MNATCEERPPISCHLPPRLPLPYDNIPSCQLYTYVALRLRQPWCPLHAAARRDAALPPSPPGDPPALGVPSTSRDRGSGRTRMCSDGTAGGRKPHRQGGQAGSRRARFGSAKSLPQKPGGPGLPVFVDGPLEADWPVCRGLIIPGAVRPLNAQGPASLEQGSGRPKIVLGRPILVRGFSPGDLSRSVGTSPAPRPRPGSRA